VKEGGGEGEGGGEEKGGGEEGEEEGGEEEGTLACYYAICIHDYIHICIRLMECEMNERTREDLNLKQHCCQTLKF